MPKIEDLKLNERFLIIDLNMTKAHCFRAATLVGDWTTGEWCEDCVDLSRGTVGALVKVYHQLINKCEDEAGS